MEHRFAVDYIKGNYAYFNQDLGRDYKFFHLDGFVELIIPSAERVHPFFGIGITHLILDYDILVTEFFSTGAYYTNIERKQEKDFGFNMKFGLQYDLSSYFFAQSYFHYTRIYNKNDSSSETFGVNFNQIKFGIGLRF